MSIRILIEESVGETRAGAFDAEGRPFALYLDRWAERRSRARWGDVHPARLRRLAPKQGGGFARLEGGEEVFLRGKTLEGLTEGAAVNVRIEAEARRGKLARASVTKDVPIVSDPLQCWQTSLPEGQVSEIETVTPGNVEIAAAYDEALAPSVTLRGGGVLRLSETPALISIDIDTAGRSDTGRAYDRARAINKIAAQEAARQLALRGLGGAVVLDCTAPIRKDTGSAVKQAFLTSFRAICTRRVEALAPSPFGLMEAVIAWGPQPIAHMVLDETNAETPLTQLLSGIRLLEREAVSDRASSFILHLPKRASTRHTEEIEAYSAELAKRYGARLTVRVSEGRKPEVEKT